MALVDYLLRLVSQAPYTTKGTALTPTELDENALILLNALVALENPGVEIDSYDPLTNYTGTMYVAFDSKLWKHIAAGTTSGVTPGTDPTKWTQVQISTLVHERNNDDQLSGLVGGLTRTVTIEQLYNLLAGGDIKTFDVTITSAEILALNATPKVLASPGAGNAIQLISCRAEILWQDSPASISYATNTTLNIKADGADRVQATVASLLAATKAMCCVIGLTTGVVDQTQIVTDADLIAEVPVGDPTLGDFDIIVSGIYREVTLNI